MTKRTRHKDDQGLNEDLLDGLEDTKRGKRGKRLRGGEGGEPMKGKRPQALPGDSPHRRRRTLSSFETPKAVTPVRGQETISPKKRKRDLHRQFEAVAKKGNEKDQVDLEITSTNHQIRVVISSPAKRKRQSQKSRRLPEDEGQELPNVRRGLMQRAVESDEGSSHPAVNEDRAPAQLSARAELSKEDTVLLPTQPAQHERDSAVIQTAWIQDEGGQANSAPVGVCAGQSPRAEVRVAVEQSTKASGGDIQEETTNVKAPLPVGCSVEGGGGPIAAGSPSSSLSPNRLQIINETTLIREPDAVETIGSRVVEAPSAQLSDSHTHLGPKPVEFPGFQELVETEVCIDSRLETSPNSTSPTSTKSVLTTPAGLDKTYPQSPYSEPLHSQFQEGAASPVAKNPTEPLHLQFQEGAASPVAKNPTEPPHSQLQEGAASPVAKNPTEPLHSQFQECAASTLAKNPSCGRLQVSSSATPLLTVPGCSSPQPPSSPILQCSIQPLPFPRSPTRKTTPSSRPPQSPKSNSAQVVGTQGIVPSIARRTNNPAGATVSGVPVNQTVKTVLKTLHERKFISTANEKVCEDVAVRKTKSRCSCEKGDGACTKSKCVRKRKGSSRKDSRGAEKGKSKDKGKGKEKEKRKGSTLTEADRHLKVLAQIETLMTELQEQKNILSMKTSPSPRESSRGQRTRAPNPVKVKQVGRKGGGKDLSSDSSNPHPSPSASGSMLLSDPFSLGTWDVVRNVPPCQVNAMAHPVGQFWRHMKNFAFERAAYTFPWHIDWSQQDAITKVRFKLRLKKLYPGDWDDAWVMQMIGNNIRERRVRLRRSFARAVSKNSVPVAGGVTLESWNAIFDSLSNPKFQAKSDKCKVAADERTRRKGFTHKLGPRGVQGLVAVFMDEFERQPTEQEVQFAKQNGIQAAVDKVRRDGDCDRMEEAVYIEQSTKKGKKRRGPKKQRRREKDSSEEDADDSSSKESEEGDDSSSNSEDDSESAETEDAADTSSGDDSDSASDDEDEEVDELEGSEFQELRECGEDDGFQPSLSETAAS